MHFKWRKYAFCNWDISAFHSSKLVLIHLSVVWTKEQLILFPQPFQWSSTVGMNLPWGAKSRGSGVCHVLHAAQIAIKVPHHTWFPAVELLRADLIKQTMGRILLCHWYWRPFRFSEPEESKSAWLYLLFQSTVLVEGRELEFSTNKAFWRRL